MQNIYKLKIKYEDYDDSWFLADDPNIDNNEILNFRFSVIGGFLYCMFNRERDYIEIHANIRLPLCFPEMKIIEKEDQDLKVYRLPFRDPSKDLCKSMAFDIRICDSNQGKYLFHLLIWQRLLGNVKLDSFANILDKIIDLNF